MLWPILDILSVTDLKRQVKTARGPVSGTIITLLKGSLVSVFVYEAFIVFSKLTSDSGPSAETSSGILKDGKSVSCLSTRG